MRKKDYTGKDKAITHALFRAAVLLDITNVDIAEIIGLNESKLSLMGTEGFMVVEESEAGKRAALFIEIFDGLEAVCGGSLQHMQTWLKTENSDMGDISPLKMVKTHEGLIFVCGYLGKVSGWT